MTDRHIYHQDGSGFEDRAAGIVYKAYSGRESGYNNPAMESVKNLGPLPKGLYTIGPLEDAEGKRGFGPGYLRLTPDPANVMHGRSGFLIHWNTHDPNPYDEIFPKDASHGCIVLMRGQNIAKITASPIKLLEVV